MLVTLDGDLLGPHLKWEVSRKGEKFPHLYGTFAVSEAEKVTPIRRNAEGRPVFPPEIP